MSYHSVHMGYPIWGGYRRSQLQVITVATLSRMTWPELRRPDPYLNGNTKWQEMEIVAFYFKNGFIDATAFKDIGYSYSASGKPGQGLVLRLSRVNIKELLNFGIKLMMSGLLKKDWTWIFDPNRKGKNCWRYSKYRIIFSKAIVNQAILKYGLNKVCMKLRVDMEVIRFWRDYEI